MSDALGPAWLIPMLSVLVAFVAGVVFPVLKIVASRWRKPLVAEVSAHAETQRKLDAAEEARTEARMEIMFLKAKLENCTGELENWRAGRWTR